MSRVNGDWEGVQVPREVNLLTPLVRGVLGKIYTGEYDKVHQQEFSALEELTTLGYLTCATKIGEMKSSLDYSISGKGRLFHEAVELFWEKISDAEDLKNLKPSKYMLLKFKNYHVLRELYASGDTATLEQLCLKLADHKPEQRPAAHNRSFIGSLLTGMKHKGFTALEEGSKTWLLTSMGKDVLLASYEFYTYLVENGFFEEDFDVDGWREVRGESGEGDFYPGKR